ncbi:CoA transferase [Sulfitobacter porphyrae]|uniref:CoA transferase n=1 Tax=Sulfitobacter porphyrae TaxID=1246864 RepID=A0ABW2B7J9_9RHOB
MDSATWPERRAAYAEVFRRKTRDEWAAIFDGTDACATPVLTWSEAPEHPQMAARGTFTEVAGVTQAAPAPRFSRSTPDDLQSPRPRDLIPRRPCANSAMMMPRLPGCATQLS